jgi:HNH endonuclease
MSNENIIVLCVYCGNRATSVDHITPQTRGGSDTEANKVPCCQPCNSSKSSKLLTEWDAYRVLHAVAVEPKVYEVLKNLPQVPPLMHARLKIDYITIPEQLSSPVVIYETVMTLKELAANQVVNLQYEALRKAAQRDINFPLPVGSGQPRLYRPGDIRQWYVIRNINIGEIAS